MIKTTSLLLRRHNSHNIIDRHEISGRIHPWWRLQTKCHRVHMEITASEAATNTTLWIVQSIALADQSQTLKCHGRIHFRYYYSFTVFGIASSPLRQTYTRQATYHTSAVALSLLVKNYFSNVFHNVYYHTWKLLRILIQMFTIDIWIMGDAPTPSWR